MNITIIGLVDLLHNMENVLLLGLNLGLMIGIVITKHHTILSKDDSYGNLMILHESVHRLIHMKDLGKIQVLIKVLQLDKKQLNESK